MADVYGTIGSDNVTLKNAATEATLKLLLQATLAANKQTIESVSKIATKAGLDPDAVQSANDNLDTMGKSGGSVSKVFYGLGFAVGAAEKGLGMMASVLNPMIDMIQGGSKNISDFGSALSGLPFGIGTVLGVLGKLAKIHEAEFAVYQKMTSAGATFGGSLTGLRFAAYNTRMTMDELAGVFTKNGDAFARMGGSAEQGRKAFMNVAESMMQSQVGDNLRALGYTSEEAVSGMASYIAGTGGRTKKEMENSAGLIAGTKAYLENLDALTQITGKNREELEKQQKEAEANASYEAYLQTLDEEGRTKAKLGMSNALALGGKAGADAYKSKILGLPPMTEAARALQALGPNVTKSIQAQADATKDHSKSVADMNRYQSEGRAGQITDMKNISQVSKAFSFMPGVMGETMMGMQAGVNQSNNQGIKTAEDADKQRKEIDAEQKKRMESQAATQVQQQNQMFEMQKALYSKLMPLIDAAGPILIMVADVFLWLIDVVTENAEILLALAAAGIAFLAIMKLRNAFESAKGARMQGQGILGQIGAATGIGGGGMLGASPTSAMWVRVVGGGLPGTGGSAGGGGGGGGGGIGSKLAEGLGGLGKGLQGLLSGLGKGAGNLIKSILNGLAGGLSSLGKPTVMLGVVTLAGLAATLYIASAALENFAKISWEDMGKGFVTLLGLGAVAAILGFASPLILTGSVALAAMGAALIPFALAMNLVALPLPIFSNNLERMSNLNAELLGKVAWSVGKLGASLITWAPFAVFGIPASYALNMMADSFVRLSNVDPIKLEKVAAAMQKVKDATPGVGAAISAGAASLINRAVGTSEPTAAVAAAPAGATTNNDMINMVSELRSLNKQTADVLKFIKETADYTKQNVSATRSLSGNHFKF